ncbi:hypothetical protein GN958_ATG10314, partial [Phytophthora infestans]
AGELGAIELHVAVAVIPEANCFWFGRWLLGNKLLDDVALVSVENEAHVSLVTSVIWCKSYFFKTVDV